MHEVVVILLQVMFKAFTWERAVPERDDEWVSDLAVSMDHSTRRTYSFQTVKLVLIRCETNGCGFDAVGLPELVFIVCGREPLTEESHGQPIDERG